MTTTESPGTIVGSEPVTVPRCPKAWRIHYRSTSAGGTPNVVSATVLLPDLPWNGVQPVVGFAVGTHGFADHCAPSHLLRTGNEPEIELIVAGLDQGWAVVVTDYEGLGTPGTHTYTVGKAQGHAMLDAVRAAPGLDARSPVALWGYAQGGQAAAFAAELQPTYAPDLPVRAVAAGAVASDLPAIIRRNDGVYTGPALGSLVGHATAYPDLPFDELLTDRGRAAAALIPGLDAPDLVARFLGTRLDDFLTVDVLDHPLWRERLAESTAGVTGPVVPTLLYHSADDEIVPVAFGERLHERYRAAGTPVHWHLLSDLAHFPAALDSAPTVVRWLDERFAEPPPTGR
ncbi:lipase family protein [Saccharothrix violaceirubra]|uniref:Fermentation-respiration switch protein FrsA (DUF1100 family) n=1 Tax=Saccharothrix violaceirubra TaxID=413306 RepID=A0A7W7T308_9PSEU|nr:lipase family protein [Saccharothrix violaceirubra]MBB4965638.1 fermentation-respiration switch protein FrsA (DUF1100 family) [Saccharothrix violaceirubra]